MRFVHLWFRETSDNAANVNIFGLGWGVGATSAPPPTGERPMVKTRTIEFSAQAKAQSPWPAVTMAMSKEPGPNVAFSTQYILWRPSDAAESAESECAASHDGHLTAHTCRGWGQATNTTHPNTESLIHHLATREPRRDHPDRTRWCEGRVALLDQEPRNTLGGVHRPSKPQTIAHLDSALPSDPAFSPCAGGRTPSTGCVQHVTCCGSTTRALPPSLFFVGLVGPIHAHTSNHTLGRLGVFSFGDIP